ncbi:Zn-dependent hydrolase [Bacillus pinisoli]|uniref:Zn-dependent hydrolase n=1 Tax=Bacillus pinisoli TaxID=2901866 RepID=UPI001FF258D0|nr:Zn-dependent hydrolase [Bacillus pinisoli]
MNLKDKLLHDYNSQLSYGGVNGERLAERLYQLSKIGLTEDNGSFRLGLSSEEKEAKHLVKEWMLQAGLEVTEDGAGNVFGKLQGNIEGNSTIMSGSHVDSVPNGGHFDGPLGVLTALEVVEAWKDTNVTPSKSFEIAIFTDEEGARFNGGFTGSGAITGQLDYSSQLKRVDGNGRTFEEVLLEYGSNEEKFRLAKRDLSEVELFVEVHIEQGKRLEKANLPVGIVSGIAGPSWMELNFYGEAGHAGNTPMDDRKDALVAASEFIYKVESLPSKVSPTAVATVGKMQVKPNGVNVIPGQVTLYVDIRDIFEDTRDSLIQLVLELAKEIAEKHHISVTNDEMLRIKPVPISKELHEKLEKTFIKNNVQPLYVPSGAGHDAMIIGNQVPTAMIFVRSKDGISHNPKEWSSLNDCVMGVHVLKDFIESLMR